MSTRYQHALRQVAPGVDVIGWGEHRYEPAIVGVSPAHVDINVDAGSGAVLRLALSLGLSEARALAVAILEAASCADRGL